MPPVCHFPKSFPKNRTDLAVVAHELRKLDSELIECRFGLPYRGVEIPRFLVRENAQLALFHVSPLSDQDLREWEQVTLFAEDGSFRLNEFLANERICLRDCGEMLKDESDAVGQFILLPRLCRTMLNRVLSESKNSQITYVSSEDCNATILLDKLRQLPNSPNLMVGRLLEIYGGAETLKPSPSPEPVQKTPEQLLFDDDQEKLIKIDLALSEEGKLVAESGTRLVTGCAGSGKSVVLLHRAKVLAENNPAGRVLVLTHNKPLRAYLEERFSRISESKNIEFSTFYSWIAQQPWRQMRRILSNVEVENRIEALKVEHDNSLSFSAEFLREEFFWITDRGLMEREAYLSAKRRGRKRRISGEQREPIYKLFQRYQESLGQDEITDWSGQAWHYLDALQAGRLSPMQYDSILIDEGQFFAPIWFQAVQKCLKPNGQLLIAADPTQGFLGVGETWTEAGVDIVGRSRVLKTPYRNTQEILAFASRFYKSRLPEEDEPVNVADSEAIEKLPKGQIPLPIQFEDAQSESNWVAKQILSNLDSRKWQPDQFLVLFEDSHQVDNFIRLLNRQKPGLATDAKEPSGAGQVRVCSINAATGLEAPIVYLLGIDRLFEDEAHLFRNAEDKPELIQRNTRKCYMALTRAMRELVIGYRRAETRSILKGELPIR